MGSSVSSSPQASVRGMVLNHRAYTPFKYREASLTCTPYKNSLTHMSASHAGQPHKLKLQARKLTRSSMPSFFSCNTTEPRLERRISG